MQKVCEKAYLEYAVKRLNGLLSGLHIPVVLVPGDIVNAVLLDIGREYYSIEMGENEGAGADN